MISTELSEADKFALLPEEQRNEILEAMTPAQRKALLKDWKFWARPKQLRCFEDDWTTFFYLGARGWGKSAPACQWVVHKARTHPGCNIAVVAATAGICNRTVVTGPGGIMEIVDPSEATHKKGEALIKFENGSVINLYAAAEPKRLRGPNHHYALADDLIAWNYPDALDMLRLTVRIGRKPQLLITSSPGSTEQILRLVSGGAIDDEQIEKAVEEFNQSEILKKDNLVIVRGTTFENTHIPQTVLDDYLMQFPVGTILHEQELQGKIVLKVDGALWDRKWIKHLETISKDPDTYGELIPPPQYIKTIVAIDPAVSVNKNSDYTAIVVASKGLDGNFYIRYAKRSKETPAKWAEEVVKVYHQFKADKILAEKNNGGLLIQETLQSQNGYWEDKVFYEVDGKNLPIELIHAKEGKYIRATPAAFLYETGKVFHVGTFGELENQMVAFKGQPNDSDDLVDALVYTLLDLSGAVPYQHRPPAVGGPRKVANLRLI